MPIWFETRAYEYDRSVNYDSTPEEIAAQQCKVSPIRFDLEKVTVYARMGKWPHQNDFKDVGGTEVNLGGPIIFIETRYKDFCVIMEKYIGKAIDETCLHE